MFLCCDRYPNSDKLALDVLSNQYKYSKIIYNIQHALPQRKYHTDKIQLNRIYVIDISQKSF